jgi:hypothetical protein
MASRVGLFKKLQGRTFAAHSADTEAWAEGIAYGTIVKANGLTMPRNYAFHCKYFALMGEIFKHQTRYATLDDLEFAFRLAIGHGHWIDTPKGPQFRPHSISFAKMDEGSCSQSYESAIQFVVDEIVPGTNNEDVQQMLLGFAA